MRIVRSSWMSILPALIVAQAWSAVKQARCSSIRAQGDTVTRNTIISFGLF